MLCWGLFMIWIFFLQTLKNRFIQIHFLFLLPELATIWSLSPNGEIPGVWQNQHSQYYTSSSEMRFLRQHERYYDKKTSHTFDRLGSPPGTKHTVFPSSYVTFICRTWESLLDTQMPVTILHIARTLPSQTCINLYINGHTHCMVFTCTWKWLLT